MIPRFLPAFFVVLLSAALLVPSAARGASEVVEVKVGGAYPTWAEFRLPFNNAGNVEVRGGALILEEGGTILETPQKLSESETYAVFRDPDGNRLGLYSHGSQEVS